MKKIVVTKILGGLGNQMFQYAAGMSLAKKNHSELFLDLHGFRNYDRHQGFQLEKVFNIRSVGLSGFGILRNFGLRGVRFSHSDVFVDGSAYYGRPGCLVRQPSHNYWDKFLDLPNKVFISGYWQSSKYFANIKDDVRSAFRFSEPLAGENLKLANLMRNKNSVCVHIRRGDYVTDPGAARFHGVCSDSYYKAAVDVIVAKVKNPTFFIFSDDGSVAEWFRTEGFNSYFVLNNQNEYSFLDMKLMTLCKNHIIANSSFSWWGAWLASHPGQIVVAPKTWFAGSEEEMEDIYEPDWIRCPN